MGRLCVILWSLENRSETRHRKMYVEKTRSVLKQILVDLRFILLTLLPNCCATLSSPVYRLISDHIFLDKWGYYLFGNASPAWFSNLVFSADMSVKTRKFWCTYDLSVFISRNNLLWYSLINKFICFHLQIKTKFASTSGNSSYYYWRCLSVKNNNFHCLQQSLQKTLAFCKIIISSICPQCAFPNN